MNAKNLTTLNGPVVAFTAAPNAEPNAKARAAGKAFYDAYHTAKEEARAAGLPTDGHSALFAVLHNGRKLAELWETRANALSRQLQAALASDALTDEQRAAIVKTVTGNTRRDAKLLAASEREMLDEYQALSSVDKVTARRIIRALGGKR
jgi:hypothetical protein